MQPHATLSGVQTDHQEIRNPGLTAAGNGHKPSCKLFYCVQGMEQCSPGSWRLIQKAFIFLIHRFAVLPHSLSSNSDFVASLKVGALYHPSQSLK